METVLKSALVISALFFHSMSVSAVQKNFVLGDLSLAGQGCLSASHKMDSSGRLRIIPQGFLVSSQSSNSVQRKACTLALNFSVNKNSALRITLPAVSGISKVARNSSAHISYETFFAGTQGEKLNIDLQGNTSRANSVFNTVGRTQQVTFACGANGTVRGNISLLLDKGQSHEVSSALIKEFGLKIDTIACR